MSQHLYFNIGEESRPVIEKLTKQDVKESLFSEQYKMHLTVFRLI